MNQESKNIDSTNAESSNEQLNGRRDFIKKFGKYGVATPVAMTTLMSPGAKAGASSDGGSSEQSGWYPGKYLGKLLG